MGGVRRQLSAFLQLEVYGDAQDPASVVDRDVEEGGWQVASQVQREEHLELRAKASPPRTEVAAVARRPQLASYQQRAEGQSPASLRCLVWLKCATDHCSAAQN